MNSNQIRMISASTGAGASVAGLVQLSHIAGFGLSHAAPAFRRTKTVVNPLSASTVAEIIRRLKVAQTGRHWRCKTERNTGTRRYRALHGLHARMGLQTGRAFRIKVTGCRIA